ncbi:lipopolysaccharide biosynthesis protein, partial [Burkholderia cenocepacia]|nr:lipopolysaccharide biosynthesis protein [Burkholderia cenocepacia]
AGYVLMCGYLAMVGAAPEVWIVALLLGVAILLREPAGVVSAWMQAHTNNRPGTIFSLVSLSLKVAAVAGLFIAGAASAPAYAIAFAAEPVVLAALLGAYYLLKVPLRRVPFDKRMAGRLLRGGMLFWVSFMTMMAVR